MSTKLKSIFLIVIQIYFFLGLSCKSIVVPFEDSIKFNTIHTKGSIHISSNGSYMEISRNHHSSKKAELRELEQRFLLKLFSSEYTSTETSKSQKALNLDSIVYLSVYDFNAQISCIDLPNFPNLLTIDYGIFKHFQLPKNKTLRNKIKKTHIDTWLDFFIRHPKLKNLEIHWLHEDVLKELLSEKYAQRWESLYLSVLYQDSTYDPFRDISQWQHNLKFVNITYPEFNNIFKLDSAFVQLQHLEDIGIPNLVDSLSYNYLSKIANLRRFHTKIMYPKEGESALRYLCQIKQLNRLSFFSNKSDFYLPKELAKLSELTELYIYADIAKDTFAFDVLEQLKNIKKADFSNFLDICAYPAFARTLQKMNSENSLELLKLRCDCWESLDSSLILEISKILPQKHYERLSPPEFILYSRRKISQKQELKVNAWTRSYEALSYHPRIGFRLYHQE